MIIDSVRTYARLYSELSVEHSYTREQFERGVVEYVLTMRANHRFVFNPQDQFGWVSVGQFYILFHTTDDPTLERSVIFEYTEHNNDPIGDYERAMSVI